MFSVTFLGLFLYHFFACKGYLFNFSLLPNFKSFMAVSMVTFVWIKSHCFRCKTVWRTVMLTWSIQKLSNVDTWSPNAADISHHFWSPIVLPKILIVHHQPKFPTCLIVAKVLYLPHLPFILVGNLKVSLI